MATPKPTPTPGRACTCAHACTLAVRHAHSHDTTSTSSDSTLEISTTNKNAQQHTSTYHRAAPHTTTNGTHSIIHSGTQFLACPVLANRSQGHRRFGRRVLRPMFCQHR
eukprot:13833500-Alexandrium_andersonii.AAC.1